MKSILQTKYGPPGILTLGEKPKPLQKDNEVLVKVYAASVNYSMAALVQGKPFIIRLMTGGITKPKYQVPGAEIAGKIEAVAEM